MFAKCGASPVLRKTPPTSALITDKGNVTWSPSYSSAAETHATLTQRKILRLKRRMSAERYLVPFDTKELPTVNLGKRLKDTEKKRHDREGNYIDILGKGDRGL